MNHLKGVSKGKQIHQRVGNVLKVIFSTIIYYALHLVALTAMVALIYEKFKGHIPFHVLNKIIFIFIPLTITAFVLRRIFPQRFTHGLSREEWKQIIISPIFIMNILAGIPYIWILPPFSTIIMLIALSFALTSLIDIEIKNIWVTSLPKIIGSYEILGQYALSVFYLAIIIIGPMILLWQALTFGKKNNRISLSQLIILLVGGGTLPFLIHMVVVNIWGENTLQTLIKNIGNKMIWFMAGSFIFGWINELFVRSVGIDDTEKESTPTSKNTFIKY